MVSFIADPRIKRAAQQRQLMLARALQPYKLPKNPYGGSPIAGNLQRLAEGYLAGQAGKRATSLEKAQKDAQAKIMAQILQLQQLPAGSTLNVEEAEEIRGIGDDGRIIPAQVSRRPYSTEMPTISAEVLETAGLSPAGWQLAEQKARTAGKTAYTAAQEAEIDRKLEAVTSAIALSGEGPERTQLQRQRSQLLAVKDAAQTAVRQETQEITRAKEARGAAREEAKAGDVPRKVFNTETLEMEIIPTREWRADRDRYKAEMPKTVDVVELATGKTTQITKKMLLQDIARGQAGEDRKYGSRRGISLVDGQLVQGAQPIGKKQTQKEVKKRVETGFHVAKAGSLLRKITDTPGLTGLRGRAAELVGGIAGQAYAPLGEFLSEVISGASPEQLAEYRVAAKTLIAGLIEEMTGEESGRFSEPERRIAETSVAALEKLSSAEQVGGAVRAAMKAYIVHGAKSDFLLGKPYDLKDKKWLIKYGTELKKLGLERDDIKDVLAQIRSAYRFLDWDKDSRRKE